MRTIIKTKKIILKSKNSSVNFTYRTAEITTIQNVVLELSERILYQHGKYLSNSLNFFDRVRTGYIFSIVLGADSVNSFTSLKPNALKYSNTDIPAMGWSEDVDVNQIINLQPPAGAHDIRVVQEYYFNCFGCCACWVDREEVTVGTTPAETYVESRYDNRNGKMILYKTDRFRD